MPARHSTMLRFGPPAPSASALHEFMVRLVDATGRAAPDWRWADLSTGLSTDLSADLPEPVLLTLADAARLLSVSLRTVQDRVAAGDLPVVRIGRCVRVRPDQLRAYVDRLTAEQQP